MMQSKRWLGAGAAAAMAMAVVLGGGASQASAAAQTAQGMARHRVSGLPVINLTVTHGRVAHHFRVEIARSFDEQEKGLMFRTAMGPNEGMIFPMNKGQPASFWMKNTVIPLDIIFIDLNHRIGNIAANAKPYDETPLPSVGVVSGVLELNGGRAAQLGIGPGDKVDW